MPMKVIGGPKDWRVSRTKEGHRKYKCKFLVGGLDTDGPAAALQAIGLPLPGSTWIISGDIDIWAWCEQTAEATQYYGGGDEPKGVYFTVETNFTTEPSWRCNKAEVLDPLSEPMHISGHYTKYQEEAWQDRFGNPIINSAFEQLRGDQVKFDANRPSIKIQQNVPQLQLEVFGPMVDTVNDAPLWNCPPRTIKLSNASWEMKRYLQCYTYFSRTFDFDVKFDTFDRLLYDAGTKALNGFWNTKGPCVNGQLQWKLIPICGNPPNPVNPSHYTRYRDMQGGFTTVILDGGGLPWQPNDPNILTCGECPDGAPTYYYAQALTEIGDLVGVVTRLQYGFGCSWFGNAGADNSTTVVLGFGITRWSLSVTVPGPLGASTTYTYLLQPNVDFLCNGTNVFVLSTAFNGAGEPQPTAGQPYAVAVTAITTPPRIPVQKYNESNFLLLGIPVILG